MKQIIVPLDFSDESMNGLELAIMISSKTKAGIQLVYVIGKTSEISDMSKEDEQRIAKSKLREIQARYEHKLPSGVDLTYIVKKGKVYKEVVEQADAFENSIIAASTQGASGFEERFIGSNAFRIITASEKPVITIRHGVVPKTFRRILLPIDYTQDTRQKVPYTAEVARIFGSKIHVLAVSSGRDQELVQRVKSWANQVVEYLNDGGIETEFSTRTGEDICDMIVDYASSEKIDLISIMTDQTSAISNFIIGNNAQQLLNRSPVPVLCITPRDLGVKGGFATSGG